MRPLHSLIYILLSLSLGRIITLYGGALQESCDSICKLDEGLRPRCSILVWSLERIRQLTLTMQEERLRLPSISPYLTYIFVAYRETYALFTFASKHIRASKALTPDLQHIRTYPFLAVLSIPNYKSRLDA